ncbi:MAG: hypothetical protein JW943_00725 [Deltaproteobacteria bacterium]|nr:hypothetical protein [Deltaproteobacteria bacterium]
MRKKRVLLLFLFLICMFTAGFVSADEMKPVKLSVFNFGTVNLEAQGYGTTVSNLLMTSFAATSCFHLLDRKDLESFLNLNELQQNDALDNIVTIGTRLNLEVIVAGTVEKRLGFITINAKVIHIPQKKIILNKQVKAFGDAALSAEIRNLSQVILKTVTEQAGAFNAGETARIKGPVNVRKKAGNKRIQITWEDMPDCKATGYEIFRSASEEGPFSKIANTSQPEYVDQDMASKKTYYYKIRSFNDRGARSDYSAVIAAEIALAPNAPIILSAEGRIKSILLTWSPNPTASEDPLALKGYKLYRARTERGSYSEVADIQGKDVGLGPGGAINKLSRVTYQDKGLADGEDYYYKLTAYNEDASESEFSLPLKGAATPAIKDFTVQGDMVREVKLAWSPVRAPFIKGYNIYRSTKEDRDFIRINRVGSDTGAGTQYVDKDGLGDNITYYYRITAYDTADMETSPSVVMSAATKGKPPAPEGFKAISGLVKKVELTWTASPHAEVEGYNLYRSQERYGKYSFIKRIDGRQNNTFTDGGENPSEKQGITRIYSYAVKSLKKDDSESLEDNTVYYYVIKSFNKVDVESELSETVSAQTKARPGKPSGLKGDRFKVKSVPLQWNPNPEKDIKAYHLYRSTDPAGGTGFTLIASTGNTSYVDNNLKDGQTCYYKIQAEDQDGLLSDFSDTAAIETKSRPRSPDDVKGAIQNGRVELRWRPGQETDIVNYTVYEKKFMGTEKIAVVNEPVFSENSPPKGKLKTYIVTAVDKDGFESDVSKEITITGQ